MMPLPWESAPPTAWRLDLLANGAAWDRGAGAARVGGRWNPVGFPVVYCSADPATAILEVAVHKGFSTLDVVPHLLTRAIVLDALDVHVVTAQEVPNPTWLQPGSPGRGQQAFGRQLLERHPFVLIPSAVSGESWNLLFNPEHAAGRYVVKAQRRFALDPRLNPPQTP
jgi:RES domain-containing protein